MEHIIKPSAKRCANGWAPMLEYSNGGRIIGQQRAETMEEAIGEAEDLINCMRNFPSAFKNNHPAKNQMIDLSQ